MHLELLEELLASKAARYERRGANYSEALRRAGEEMLAAAKDRLRGAELFCYRVCLKGAGRSLGGQRLGEVLGGLARCRSLLRQVADRPESEAPVALAREHSGMDLIHSARSARKRRVRGQRPSPKAGLKG